MDYNRIDDKLAQLKNARPLTQGELSRLNEHFLVEYTYNSNAIEGNTLTLRETMLIIKEGLTIAEKPLREHLEVVGHRDAYYYVESLVEEKIPLSERVIKDIHAIVLIDRQLDKGVYRSVPVYISGSVHTPPEPYMVPIEMERLMLDYEEMKHALHPVARAALFHLRFEGVHPFIDGNGRTGRLIMNLELMKDGFPPINIKFADRRRYYDCFHSFHASGGNFGDMEAMVGEYVEAALDSYLETIDKKERLHRQSPER